MVPLYYRFIRLLWVGPSVQPSLKTCVSGGEEGTWMPETQWWHPCPSLGLRGVSGCAEAGHVVTEQAALVLCVLSASLGPGAPSSPL